MSRPGRGEAVKKASVRLPAGLMVLMIILGVLLSAASGYAEELPRDQYELRLEVLLDEQIVRVTQNVTCVNRTGKALDSMMFGVYANVLRRQSAIPVESERREAAFPAGYAPGGMDFMSVRVNGEKAQWAVQGAEETFMRVECPLKAGESAQFTFEYYLLLPCFSGSMGVGDLTWRLSNFYPSVLVWDEYAQDFVRNGYTAMGEPLYSECADFRVTLSLPETYALAAPGVVDAVNEGGTVHYEITAEQMRSMTLIFSRKMFPRSAQTESGTDIQVWANTARAADAILKEAKGMMDYLENGLGAYPWERLTLIETEYLYEGLSQPGVIQISNRLCGAFEGEELAKAVRKLCAQQYFECIAGVNRSEYPWLSDGLSAYMALTYIDDTQGRDAYLKAFNAQILPSLQITIPGGMTVDSTAGRFNSRMEYELITVDRCAVILHDMRQSMGEEVFMAALREYIDRTSMGNAVVIEFLEAMRDVSGRSWNEYLYGQMHNMDDYVSESIEWYE